MAVLKGQSGKVMAEKNHCDSAHGNIPASTRRVLELWCTLDCNENCLMCPTKSASGRYLDKDVFEKIVLKHFSKGVKQVNLQGGEPTLIPDIDRYVYLARKIGAIVKLDTNGVRLADGDFVSRLKCAGISSCLVSLHSMDETTSEAIVGRKRTFYRTIAGLHRLAHAEIPFTISFVINALNYREIPDFVKFCEKSFGGAEYRLALSFVIPIHHAWKNRDRIVPRLTEAMPFLENALSAARRLGTKIMIPSFGGIPLCALPSIYGFREYFDTFAAVAVEELSDGVELPVGVRKTRYTGGYSKIYLDDCGVCSAGNQCPGIFRNYIRIHGDSEFHPIPFLPG